MNPSEKVILDEPNEYYDLVLFGPPYYNLELYDGDNPNQSSNAYTTYEDWLEGYWDGTLKNIIPYLKKGCPFSFCIGNFKNVFGEQGKESYNEIDISKDMLKPKGVLVSKVFMGEDFIEVKNLAKSIFKTVNFFKPNSSRSESKETYIHCNTLKIL